MLSLNTLGHLIINLKINLKKWSKIKVVELTGQCKMAPPVEQEPSIEYYLSEVGSGLVSQVPGLSDAQGMVGKKKNGAQ